MCHTSHERNNKFGQSYVTLIPVILIMLRSIFDKLGVQDADLELF
jgi:hypothetical protein